MVDGADGLGSAEPVTTESSDLVLVVPGRGVQQRLGDRVASVARLLPVWTKREMRARYRQSILGGSWGLIQPMALLAIYGWTVTAVLDVTPTELPYLVFAWSGVVPFAFFSQALSAAVGSIQSAGPLISRVYFPREILPLSAVSATLIDLLVMTVILIAAGWVQVGRPTLTLVALVPVLAVLAIWTIAVSLAVATATVFRRDLNHAVPLALRALFIISPVVYSAELLQNRAPWLYAANPLAVVIEGTRDAALRGVWPEPVLLSVHGGVGVVLLLGFSLLFRRVESSMGDYV